MAKQHATKQPKRKLKNTLRQMKIKSQASSLWDAAKSVLKEKFIEIQSCLKKSLNSQSNFIFKGTRIRRTNKFTVIEGRK